MKLQSFVAVPLDHEEVKKRHGEDLIYMGELPYDDTTWAVYYNRDPDKKKKHKDYLLISIHYVQGVPCSVVTGLSKKQMEKHRKMSGILCKKCGEVIWSLFRHDYHSCSCGNASVDGGDAYFRACYEDFANIEFVTIDVITKEVVVQPKDTIKTNK